jgi:hypothetical protein
MTNLDYIKGWDAGDLQKAVDNCHCDEYGEYFLKTLHLPATVLPAAVIIEL